MVGDLEVPGGARAVAEAARAARSSPAPPRAADVLLDAFATRLTDGYAAAAPALARGLELLLASDVTNEDVGRSLSLVSNRASAIVALELWDVEAFHLLASRRVQLARDTGALVHLRFALSFLARSQLLAGEVTAATSTIDEAQLIAEASGNLPLVNAPMILAAWRGQEERASELIEATAEEAAARRWTSNAYARSVLYNGLGRHDAARDAAREAFQHDLVGHGPFLVPELAEAASRTGDTALLESALEWLSGRTRVVSSEWVLGIEARVRALLSEGEVAERLYRDSIVHLSGNRVRLDLARTHLLYGEWLRRERRRLDAREQLRTALEMFTSMGTDAFAARAERELLATGERVRKRTVETRDELTASGGSDRQTRQRGLVERRDRRATVHQPAHRRLPPAQGVQQARHHLAQPARPGAARRRRPADGVTSAQITPRTGHQISLATPHRRIRPASAADRQTSPPNAAKEKSATTANRVDLRGASLRACRRAGRWTGRPRSCNRRGLACSSGSRRRDRSVG